jgi:hypothetical protein
MKRVITFDAPAEFDLLYQGFLFGGSQQQTKTMVSLRSEARVLDKLDAISEPSIDEQGKIDKYPTGDPVRKYASGELLLTNDEYELIKKYFESVPWATKVSREVVKLFDKINDAEERPDISPVK